MTEAAAEKPSLKEAIFNRRMLICVFTGFSSGLPLFLLFQMVPAWLRMEGVGLAEIGFFTLIQFPYVWKFVWAPAVDRYVLPFLGRRRGWMLVTQIALLITIAAMGLFNPTISLGVVAGLAATVAFFSATQDIVLDAYRRELLADSELGLGNAIHVQTYRFAGLVPGGLGLILSDFLPWSSVFVIIAAFMLVGIVMTLVIDEAISEPDTPKTLKEAVINPFREFIGRNGLSSAVFVLAFIFFYKLGDNMAVALQTPFFVDLGFSGTEIGTIAKLTGLTATHVGVMLGGIIMVKLGINRALWCFGLVQMLTILAFAGLAEVGNDRLMLAGAMAFEYLGVGLGTAALTAFIARSTDPAFAATQLSLFTALAAVPRVASNAVTGVIVEQMGWTNFFVLCMFLAVPGMLLLFKVAPWNETDDAEVQAA